MKPTIIFANRKWPNSKYTQTKKKKRKIKIRNKQFTSNTTYTNIRPNSISIHNFFLLLLTIQDYRKRPTPMCVCVLMWNTQMKWINEKKAVDEIVFKNHT